VDVDGLLEGAELGCDEILGESLATKLGAELVDGCDDNDGPLLTLGPLDVLGALEMEGSKLGLCVGAKLIDGSEVGALVGAEEILGLKLPTTVGIDERVGELEG